MPRPSISRRNLFLGLGAAGALTLGAALWRETGFLRSGTRSSVSLRRIARVELKGSVATNGRSEVDALVWSPDGRRLAVSFDWGHAVAFIDASTWKEVGRIEEKTRENLKSVAFLSDTELLAMGGDRNSRTAFTIYDIETGKLVREIACPSSCPATFKADLSRAVAITSSRKYAVLATQHPSPSLLLFDVASEKFIGELAGVPHPTLAVLAAGPGDMLAASTYSPPFSEPRKGLYLVDAKVNKVDRILLGHVPRVSSLAWSPNGQLLASGAAGFESVGAHAAASDGKPKWIRDVDPVRVWNAATGEMVVSFAGEIESIKHLTWHPSGRVFAAAGSRGDGGVGSALRLWSVPDRKMIFEYFTPNPSFFFRYILPTGGHITALSFHPVTGHLVMGYDEGLEIFEVSGLS